MGFWDDLIILFRGKRIGILGPRAAGKTTLHSWLRDRRLPEEYRPTLAAEPQARARPKLQDGSAERRVAIKKGRDVPGDFIPNLEAWRGVIAESDVLLYLFDANRLVKNDAEHRREVSRDCGAVGALLAEEHGGASLPKLALVGTHCDLVEGYCPPEDRKGFLSFSRGINELQVVEDSLWRCANRWTGPRSRSWYSDRSATRRAPRSWRTASWSCTLLCDSLRR